MMYKIERRSRKEKIFLLFLSSTRFILKTPCLEHHKSNTTSEYTWKGWPAVVKEQEESNWETSYLRSYLWSCLATFVSAGVAPSSRSSRLVFLLHFLRHHNKFTTIYTDMRERAREQVEADTSLAILGCDWVETHYFPVTTLDQPWLLHPPLPYPPPAVSTVSNTWPPSQQPPPPTWLQLLQGWPSRNSLPWKRARGSGPREWPSP